jgi:2-polyprenyl-3-methyl-5-hydroxy-6-metoxy-1,4-benzoquinol methylase
VRFVELDPPGTFCNHEALRDVVKRIRPRRFVVVGCGGGDVSKLLCSLGMAGTGIDFSRAAIEKSRQRLRKEIEAGTYTLIEGDVTALGRDALAPCDLGVSFMVMEHVEDDVGFVRTVGRLVRPGGYLAVGVPGRKDRWSFEDETVGHLRRYDREDLQRVLEAGGLREVEIWSVAVPVANVLFRIGEWLVRHSDEAKKAGLSQRAQTEASGLQDIAWKTTFPVWLKVVLNRYTLYPVLAFQRLFYRSGLGVTMLGFGRVGTST